MMWRRWVTRHVLPAAIAATLGCGPRYGEITGEVVDGYTREPVAGAAVTLLEVGRQATTDETGEFRFLTVPPGSYSLGATKLHYSEGGPAMVQVSGGASARIPDLEILCIAPDCAGSYGNVIQGKVEDRYTGGALRGVSVALRSNLREVTVTTGGDGSYRFEGLLPLEDCGLTFFLAGYGSERREARLAGGIRQRIVADAALACVAPECAAAYGNVLVGSVRDRYTQDPLFQVQVTLRSGMIQATATTDVQGGFSFRNLLPKQRCEVAFSLDRYSTFSREVEFADSIQQELRVDAELFCVIGACAERYGVSAGGRVVDFRTKRPLAEATVLAEVAHAGSTRAENLVAWTDRMGVFAMNGLLPNDTVTIRVKEPGAAEPGAWRKTFQVPDRIQQKIDLGVLDLLYGGRFLEAADGTVLDTVTQLIWVKDPSLLGGQFGTPGAPAGMTRAAAETACQGLSHAGTSDWRLPTFAEMDSLYEGLGGVTKERDRRVEPFGWGGDPQSRYWTSDRTPNTVRYFDVALGPGEAGWIPTTLKPRQLPLVRPVRSPVGE